jgi:hypothetical protein
MHGYGGRWLAALVTSIARPMAVRLLPLERRLVDPLPVLNVCHVRAERTCTDADRKTGLCVSEPRQGSGRVAHQCLGDAVFDDAASLEDQDPRKSHRVIHVVGHEQQRCILKALPELLEERVSQRAFQRAQRLIE